MPWADLPSRITTALRSRTVVADAALWVLLIAPAPLSIHDLPGHVPLLGAGAVLVTVGVVTSRRAPFLSLMAATALCLPYLAGSAAPGSWSFPAIVVLGYLAGRRMAQGRPALPGFAAIALAGLALSAAAGDVWRWLPLLMVELLAVGAWWVGRFSRLRAQLTQAGWEHAERLEREQLMVAAQARLRERARIAEDMHDFLGHELSLLALQAGALELAPDLGDEHRAMIIRLRVGASTAIDLLHDTIGLLRDDCDPARLAPASDSVTDLIGRAAQSGVPVSLVTTGALARLSPMAERAAYRVVQESLTNAIKHAPGRPVTVRLHHDHDGLTVTVRNALAGGDARPSGPVDSPGSGSGLIGLHERVRLAGGALETTVHDGVFSVSARFPRDHGPPAARPGPAPPAAGAAASAQDQRQARRRQVRRQMLVTAVLPITLVVALAATLISMRLYTVSRTALATDAFDQLAIGQSRAEIAHLLPGSSLDKAPPVVAEPSPPQGARCDYYQVGGAPLNLSNDLYRLCFRDGTLVSRDRLDGQQVP